MFGSESRKGERERGGWSDECFNSRVDRNQFLIMKRVINRIQPFVMIIVVGVSPRRRREWRELAACHNV